MPAWPYHSRKHGEKKNFDTLSLFSYFDVNKSGVTVFSNKKKLDGKPEEKRMRSGIGVKELSFPSQNRF